MMDKPKIRFVNIRERPSDYFLRTGIMVWRTQLMTLDEIRKMYPDASILPENKKKDDSNA